MKTIYSLAILFLLSSCSVVVKTPMNRFDSPETRGEGGKFEGLVGYQGRNETQLTPDYLTTAPTVTSPSMPPPGHRVIMNGSVGLIESLDLTINLNEARAGLKWQLLGAPFEGAKKGNIPLSVTSSVASAKESDSGTVGNNNRSVDVKELVYDLAVVSGYRFDKTLLAYGGPFVVWDRIRTSYKTNAGTNDLEGTLQSIGVNLGMEFDFPALFFRVEGAATQTQLGITKVGRATYGAALGARF